MRINKTNSKLPNLIIATSVVVLLGAALYGTYAHKVWPFNGQQSITAEQEAANNSDITNSQQKTGADKATTNQDVDTSKTTDEVPVAESTSVSITRLSQENGQVSYEAAITNPGATGSCSAVFTNKIAKPVTQVTPSSGDKCGPVHIPETSFSALGEWTLTLRYYTNDTQATATKTIEIK